MEAQKAILVIQNGTAMEQLTAGDNGTQRRATVGRPK